MRWATRTAATSAMAVGLVAGSARAEPWAAASGLHGAGLGLREDATARLWMDTAFFTREGTTILSPYLGAGIFASEDLEVEGVVPLSFAFGDDGALAVGNPYVGVSYVQQGPDLRLKLGGGIALPVLDAESFDELGAAVGAVATRGLQDGWFWFNDGLAIVPQLHLEAPASGPASFIGDASFYVVAPVRDRTDPEVALQVAPGLAAYAGDAAAIGVRLPVFVVLTNDAGDQAQLALEPFVRLAFDGAFASVRFTMPIDEPLGFAFDDDGIWGFHLGVGGAF